MTITRFEPQMYGTHEGGYPEGSPEAVAAVARVKAIMGKRNPAFRKTPRPTPPETRTVFADWLCGAMASHGDSIAALAAALDMGSSAVCRWRSGASTPWVAKRSAIAERYGITVERIEELMSEEEEAA